MAYFTAAVTCGVFIQVQHISHRMLKFISRHASKLPSAVRRREGMLCFGIRHPHHRY